MRADLHLSPVNKSALVSFSHTAYIGSMLYETLTQQDGEFGKILHDDTRIKLFNLSALRSPSMRHLRTEDWSSSGYCFEGKTIATISTPKPGLFIRLTEGLLKKGVIRIGAAEFKVDDVVITDIPVFQKGMGWRTSVGTSIATYWTVRDEYKIYMIPEMEEEGLPKCETIIIKNLIHKWERFVEDEPEIADAWLNLYKVSREEMKDASKMNIILMDVKPKTTVINKITYKTWVGKIILKAPPPIQRLAWSCGMGGNNSMGCGMVEIMGGSR